MPFYALMLHPALERVAFGSDGDDDRGLGAYVERPGGAPIPWRRWLALGLGVAPAVAFFFAYNQIRFGTALESGYALATLPDWLERQRAMGLFSIAHIPMNIDYFLLHLPRPLATFPHPARRARPVGVPDPAGVVLALRADWRRQRSWWLAGGHRRADPPLLYYCGAAPVRLPLLLDSVPFVMALCGSVQSARGGVGWGGRYYRVRHQRHGHHVYGPIT